MGKGPKKSRKPLGGGGEVWDRRIRGIKKKRLGLCAELGKGSTRLGNEKSTLGQDNFECEKNFAELHLEKKKDRHFTN